MVAMDIEMYGQELGRLHRPHGEFACISVAVEGDPKIYQVYDTTDLRKMLSAVKQGTWAFHNSVYDLRQIMRYMNLKERFIWDTMLVDKSMYAGYYFLFGLDDLSRRWLGDVMDKETVKDFSTAREMSPAMKKYAAVDAANTLDIAIMQRNAFEDDLSFKAYTDFDMPCIWPVLETEGVTIDVDAWKKAVEFFKRRAERIENILDINVKSPQQVKRALSTVRHIHLENTAKETLEGYKDDVYVRLVILGRRFRDAVSKYGESWLEKFVEDDGKVYADYKINGASTTARWSCANPNMQQIPARHLPIYRTFFTASPNSWMLVSDVSQEEPRITCYHSEDEELLKAFKNKEDLHSYVARIVYNDPTIDKSDEKRRNVGKTINLGTTYGMSRFGLAKKLKITEAEADVFLNSYFSRFTGVFNWISHQRQQGFSQGYVKSISGRRLYINLYDHQWENNAINSPIQGGAADFGKMWERKYYDNCKLQGLQFCLVLRIHDEFGLDVPAGVYKEHKKALLDGFNETAETLFPGVPFEHDTVRGKSWACSKLKDEIYEEEE